MLSPSALLSLTLPLMLLFASCSTDPRDDKLFVNWKEADRLHKAPRKDELARTKAEEEQLVRELDQVTRATNTLADEVRAMEAKVPNMRSRANRSGDADLVRRVNQLERDMRNVNSQGAETAALRRQVAELEQDVASLESALRKF